MNLTGVCILIALLLTAGFFAVFGINPMDGLRRLRRWRPPKRERKITTAQFLRQLEGKKREDPFRKNLSSAKQSLTVIGQGYRYRRTVILSMVCGGTGALLALILFSSLLLAAVLGVGCALLPLWLVQLSVYTHTQHVNNELETALSLITTAYTRHGDIVRAVEEASASAGLPVRQVLREFVTDVRYVDSNIEGGILRMKGKLDNALFHQWCDILILCQRDHSLKAGLRPVVTKFSELKAQQSENETLMMLPLREVLTMALITSGVIPLLYVLNEDWYRYLVHTPAGRMAMAVQVILIFAAIHKAIRLARPVEYRL